MKEYMRKYVKNMEKYVENMKKEEIYGNMRKICSNMWLWDLEVRAVI